MNQKIPLSEYPRPQLKRDSYLCLNGEWEYAIRDRKDIPPVFDGKIIVPFSPETDLSGVNKMVGPNDWLFYHKQFSLDKTFIKDKVLLHFTAVDQIAEVYLNGQYIGKHIGGYLPFEFDIKNYLKENNDLVVVVKDYSDTSYYSRGKQRIKRGGIWYTPQSGIYMPVWIESVPNDYIQDLKIVPHIERKEVLIKVASQANSASVKIQNKKYDIRTNKFVSLKVNDMHLWSPEDPYLYNIVVSTNSDTVHSYFAMRKVSLVMHNGQKVIALNDKPYFMKGVLDQGYYKEGLYTPKDYSDYEKDLQLIKDLGFNTVRKHIKIEAPIWYYLCDKMGLLVWQDFVNGGENYKFSTIVFPLITNIHHKDTWHAKFSRSNIDGRKQAVEEFKDTINYLFNHPSIVLWTIFNEGWGQFDSKDIYEDLRKIDGTRLFDHASGWHDQGISDVKSMHVYFKKVEMPKKKNIKNRAVVLSEFGGLLLPIEGHDRKGKKTYKSFKNKDEWLKAYREMIQRDVINNIPKGLAASIYTQLSDVEDELNGFVTFDREVIKVNPKEIKEINDKIKF